MNAPETRERELSPLQKIPDNYEKLVVCMDTGLQQEQDGIRIVNAIDFCWSKRRMMQFMLYLCHIKKESGA